MTSKEDELNLLLSKLDRAFEKAEKQNEGGNGTATVSTIDVDLDHERVVSGVKSLKSKGYLALEERKANLCFLTQEGESYAGNGSPEFLLVKLVRDREAVALDEAMKLVHNGDLGLKKAMKERYLTLDKDKTLRPGASTLEFDRTQTLLLTVRDFGSNEDKMLAEMAKLVPDRRELDNEIADLRKRKLVSTRTTVYYNVTKTADYKSTVRPQLTDLTMELLETDMKKYNFFSSGKRVAAGDFHPLVHTMHEFRRILTAMGFQELDTNRYIESSFWCFDAMYIPQQHPARDTQDTFFLRVGRPQPQDPERANPEFLDETYVKNVSVAHGDASAYNSTGWRSLDESLRTVLRTHVTPCTARKLKEIADAYQRVARPNAQGTPITPCKYFAIDRVFRNEASDSTHLCEFHQIEGFVVGFDLGLGDLMGVMDTFYSAIGIHDLKFKPAFNPYTEPSMEIFGFHKLLNTWIEVGNSGIFRPEMLLPMGLPENLTVIAWGLSLERPTMVRHNIKNIRDLVGCKY